MSISNKANAGIKFPVWYYSKCQKTLIFIFFYYPLLVKPYPALKTTMEIFGIFWQIEANSLRHQRSPLSFLLLFPTVQTQKKKKRKENHTMGQKSQFRIFCSLYKRRGRAVVVWLWLYGAMYIVYKCGAI